MAALFELLCGSAPGAASVSECEHALDAALARARAARPAVAIDDASFVRYLAERVEDEDVSAWLARARVDDLLLACGCLAGDGAALASFEREFSAELLAAAGRVGLPEADAADVVAEVHEKLLVGRRLGDYGGRGPIGTWLRVVTTRAAVSAARRLGRGRRDDADLVDLVAPLGDPEVALLTTELRVAVKAAFAEAAAGLDARERNLLRQHLLDGLTIDELGVLYRVHRVTAARWLARARERAWEATAQALRTRLPKAPPELDSLLAAVRTGLDLSLERVLAG